MKKSWTTTKNFVSFTFPPIFLYIRNFPRPCGQCKVQKRLRCVQGSKCNALRAFKGGSHASSRRGRPLCLPEQQRTPEALYPSTGLYPLRSSFIREDFTRSSATHICTCTQVLCPFLSSNTLSTFGFCLNMSKITFA